jgi:hypothetical protein
MEAAARRRLRPRAKVASAECLFTLKSGKFMTDYVP